MARIKHIEIAGKNGANLADFYRDLLGWKISRRDVGGFDYYDIDRAGNPTAGIRSEPDGKPEIVAYIEVDDLESVFAGAKSLGANVRIPPKEYGELRFALIEDPEGNPIGLTQA